MEDAHGPPASEGRVGVLPLVCEAAQRMTLLVPRPLLLVCSTSRLSLILALVYVRLWLKAAG